MPGFSICLSFLCLVAGFPGGVVALVDLGTLKMILKYKTECEISLCHQELLSSALRGAYVSLSLLSHSLQLVETCMTNQLLARSFRGRYVAAPLPGEAATADACYPAWREDPQEAT